MEEIYKINALKNCVNCNICCSSPYGSPFILEEEVKKIQEYSKEKGLNDKLIPVDNHFEIEKKDNGDCGYLNEQGLCDIYEVRPLDCRIFPLGFTQTGGVGVCEICPEKENLSDIFLETAPKTLIKYFGHIKDKLIEQSTKGGFIFK